MLSSSTPARRLSVSLRGALEVSEVVSSFLAASTRESELEEARRRHAMAPKWLVSKRKRVGMRREKSWKF